MKKFFEGLSLSSIVAGTLAAVTSFLLASKIGIAGSVIGAAASYIVSAVATKIYQNILTASGEKLQSASSSGNDDDTLAFWFFGFVVGQCFFKGSLEGTFKLFGKFPADSDLPVSQCPIQIF